MLIIMVLIVKLKNSLFTAFNVESMSSRETMKF